MKEFTYDETISIKDFNFTSFEKMMGLGIIGALIGGLIGATSTFINYEFNLMSEILLAGVSATTYGLLGSGVGLMLGWLVILKEHYFEK